MSPVDFTLTWEHAVRLLIRGLLEGHPVVVEVDFWMVREKHVGAGPILRHGCRRSPLRLANFAHGDKEEGKYLSSVAG